MKFCAAFALLLLFSNCSYSDKTETVSRDVDMHLAKGDAVYGGNFTFMTPEKIQGLFSASADDLYSFRLSSLFYEGLLRFDQNSTDLKLALAESYEVSEDLRRYTITLRKGVFFHSDSCFIESNPREVVATDVKFMFDFICSSDKRNLYSDLFIDKIKGAKRFYSKGKLLNDEKGVSGVQVLDRYRVSIELNHPDVAFERYLAHAALRIFPREALDMYGDKIGIHPVGTGPFVLTNLSQDKMVVKRNLNYWEKDDLGNQLPYLDSITVLYSSDKKQELQFFGQKEIDLVTEIPVDHIENILFSLEEAKMGKNIKHNIYSKSSLSTEYYAFSQNNSVFEDVRIRKAFSMVIDKPYIVETVLNGEGISASNGFVPKMKDYPKEKIQGYGFDIREGQRLLEEAGFKNGIGFPQVYLIVNAPKNSSKYLLAKSVVTSLQSNLGVRVQVKNVSLTDRDSLIASGEAIFWRAGWLADIPDPVDFLNLFYSSNSINTLGYANAEFDRLFDKAKMEKNRLKRMELLAACDQIITKDAVVIPLVMDEFVSLTNARIRNFMANEMEEINFSRIFIKELNE